MNKSQLVDSVAEKSGISKADAKKAVEAFVDSVKETLVAGDKLALIGFGTFSIQERAEREGRNPATGASMTIPAKKLVKFKAGAELSGAVN